MAKKTAARATPRRRRHPLDELIALTKQLRQGVENLVGAYADLSARVHALETAAPPAPPLPVIPPATPPARKGRAK